MFERGSGRRVRLFLAVLAPGQVVKGSAAVGDAPMRHHAAGIEFNCFVKTFYGFVLVEPKAPVQAKIEPALRFRRSGGNRASVSTEVETVHSLVPYPKTSRTRCGRDLLQFRQAMHGFRCREIASDDRVIHLAERQHIPQSERSEE